MFDVLTKLHAKELQKLKLFHSVDSASIECILDACVIRRLKKEEILLTPGQQNGNLFQLMSGRLRIHLDSPFSEPVSFVEPGETVGEMSIIDHSPTSAYVIADEDSRLLLMKEDLVWGLMELSHTAAFNLLKVLTQRLREADRVISDKIRLETSYYNFGNTDIVTGLHNRQWLDLILPRQMARSTISGKQFSLILFDIDDFRQFNDKYGRLSGDLAISRVARAIMEHMRPTEVAVRYGGDQFLILIPDVDMKVTRSIAERIRKRVMYVEMTSPDGRKLPSITISLGIAHFQNGQSPADLLQVLEAALDRAKKMGKNFVSE